MIYAELNPLFTGANCADVLLKTAEKLEFEHFNDVICAYRNYFRKSCCSMIYAEFSPIFTGANCAYILSTAAVKLNFENSYRKYFRKVVKA